MKKYMALTAAALMLTMLTACGSGFAEAPSETIGPAPANESTGLSYIDTQNEEIAQGTRPVSDETEDDYTERGFVDIRGVYGETEIPDVPCEDPDPEGCERTSQILPTGLGSMVFETHTFGDYTISLVGEYVRTDKEGFPDRIFARDLYVEAEWNGEKLSDHAGYTGNFLGIASSASGEYIILPDRIGNYLDIYELERPVIAMRYYFADGTGYTDVDKAVQFSMIWDEKTLGGFLGDFDAGLGVVFNREPAPDRKELVTNPEPERWRVGLFSSDEFEVIDDKTLVDKDAGIKFTFDFADDPRDSLFTSQKL